MTIIQGEEKKIDRLKESLKGLLFFNIVGFFILIHTALDYRLLNVGSEKIVEYQIPQQVQYQYVPKNGRTSAYIAIFNESEWVTELSCMDYSHQLCSLFEDSANQFKTIELLARYYSGSPEHRRRYIFREATYLNEAQEQQTVFFDTSHYEKLTYLHTLENELVTYAGYFSLLLGFLLLVFFAYSFDPEKISPLVRLQKKDFEAEFLKYRKILLRLLLFNLAIVWIFIFLLSKFRFSFNFSLDH